MECDQAIDSFQIDQIGLRVQGAQSQFCCAISNVSDSPNIPKNSSSAQLQHMLRGMSLPKIAPSGYSQ